MNSSQADHIAKAIEHLNHAINDDHTHLLYERRYTEWHQRVLQTAIARAAAEILTQEHQVQHQASESWLSDSGHGTSRQQIQPVDSRLS